jgi:hypothetical protein
MKLPHELSGQSGVCRLTAWLDGGTGGSGSFEPNQAAWAAFEFTLNPGDVGDDENTGSAKRARIQVTGTGVNSSGQTRGFLLVPRTAGQ